MFQTKKQNKPLSSLKEWFVIFNDHQEGPYSLRDLKKDRRFTPDTLVWKKGFQEWIASRFVPEMRDVFKDAPEITKNPENESRSLESDVGQQNQATLTLQQDPHQFFLWFILLLIIIFYTFYLFNK